MIASNVFPAIRWSALKVIGALIPIIIMTDPARSASQPTPAFYDLFHNKMNWLNGAASIHVKGHSHIRITNGDGKSMDAPRDGNFDLWVDVPDMSRFSIKESPEVATRRDTKGNVVGFHIVDVTKTSDGSTMVEQRYRPSRVEGIPPSCLALIDNYDPSKRWISLLNTGLAFLWPFNAIYNKEWYGPLDSTAHSVNLQYKGEDETSYFFEADGVNVFADSFDGESRIDEVRSSFLNSFDKAASSPIGRTAPNEDSREFVPFKLAVAKLPGNPLKSLTITYSAKPGGSDVTTQIIYSVQDFMIVGTNWVPKHMTYDVHNKGFTFHTEIGLDQVEVSPRPLPDASVKPVFASQTDIYDTRLNVVFRAGSAPENILNHFRFLDRTGEHGGTDDEKNP